MDPNSFHVRCMAHVNNLAVKECMLKVYSKIEKIRYLLSAIRASVKCRDLFESVSKELHLTCQLPNPDSETRWSSTLIMI